MNKRVGLDWKHASIDVKNEYKKKALDIAVGAVDSSPVRVFSFLDRHFNTK